MAAIMAFGADEETEKLLYEHFPGLAALDKHREVKGETHKQLYYDAARTAKTKMKKDWEEAHDQNPKVPSWR